MNSPREKGKAGVEESKQRPSKNKIFAHIQKELETKNNAKPAKLNESEQVGGS